MPIHVSIRYTWYIKYLILFYDYTFILAPLRLSMYRHISLSKLHTPYVDMKLNIMEGYYINTKFAEKPQNDIK